MSNDLQLSIFIAGVFISVTLLISVLGLYIMRRQRVRLRIAADAAGFKTSPGFNSGTTRLSFNQVDDRLLGLDNKMSRSKLQMELIQGGFFSPQAPKNYLIARSLVTLGLPLAGYLADKMFHFLHSGPAELMFFSLLVVMGYILPDAYLKRRQRHLVNSYRQLFPDLLDLLVVCVDAGLSFNMALERIAEEFGRRSYELATNLALLNGEIRSGRAIPDALDNLSVRTNLDDVKKFSTLMKQSIELGTDVGSALRVYAGEMREKRMSLAEEKANALPIKMLLPLGLFIFPTILIVVLTPPIIKVIDAFKQVGAH
ncbi:type II secretion system F family protein [Rhodoblastus sp.]|uniref:type II secretion system F family protein n=1 Tax=Rhodoblastus sp. TaxID=1962975 RepID=UPI003F9EA8CB